MNIVHVEVRKETVLNIAITSKEAILERSRERMKKDGWMAVNIRGLAEDCGVSVGTIYNYFDSKSDLLAATIESIWQDIFHFEELGKPFQSFTDCVWRIFDSMKKGDERYPEFFQSHPISFMGEEKQNGKERMEQSWKHMKEGMHQALIQDENVSAEVFDNVFTSEKFVDIIFSLILSAQVTRNYDCSEILEMISRVIYR